MCSIAGCEREGLLRRGMCKMHYSRWWRANRTVHPTTEERFWSKVDRDGPIPETRPDLGPCWIWTGGLVDGYGRFRGEGGRLVLTHRFAYELLVGPIPEGLQNDHLCRVRRCCNPAHLEPVTGRVNVLRGEGRAAMQARQTHCVHGHRLDKGNTYLEPKNGKRRCRICKRAANNARYHRHRAEGRKR